MENLTKNDTVKTVAIQFIKMVSIGLMAGALSLEAWHLVAVWQNYPFPLNEAIFWFTRIPVCAHLIEALIAAWYSPSRQQSAWPYSLYTFWVGTIALIELFESVPERDRESA